MFRFLKNKILSALLILSSLSYGAQSQENSVEHPDQIQSENTKVMHLNINGNPFYIPPEEPTREERKKKAVLMYWSHLDPKTGKIITIKYPDTLKIKEEEPTEKYDDSDLTLFGWQKAHASIDKTDLPKKAHPSIAPRVQEHKQETIVAPDPLDQILEKLETEEQKLVDSQVSSAVVTNLGASAVSQTNTISKVREPIVPSVSCSNQTSCVTNVVKSEEEDRAFMADIPCITNSSNMTEIEELMNLLEEENPTNNTSQSTAISTKRNPLDVEKQDMIDLRNMALPTPDSKGSEQKDLVELLQLLEQENAYSQNTNQQSYCKKIDNISAQNSTNVFNSTHSSQNDIQDALDQLSQSVPTVPSNPSLPMKKTGLFVGAIGGAAILGMSRMTQKKKRKAALDLIPATTISKDLVDKRNAVAIKLKAVRTIRDIKNERTALTKEMALARKNHDENKIQQILLRRKELTQLRRRACLCITDPYTTKIKEQRRLLTKKMTLARKRKNNRMMSKITQKRVVLKERVKALNAYVWEFDYQNQRVRFIKRDTMRVIALHRGIKTR